MSDTTQQYRMETGPDALYLTMSLDELRVQYALLRDLYRAQVTVHSAACVRWDHERQVWASCAARLADTEKALEDARKQIAALPKPSAPQQDFTEWTEVTEPPEDFSMEKYEAQWWTYQDNLWRDYGPGRALPCWEVQVMRRRIRLRREVKA